MEQCSGLLLFLCALVWLATMTMVVILLVSLATTLVRPVQMLVSV